MSLPLRLVLVSCLVFLAVNSAVGQRGPSLEPTIDSEAPVCEDSPFLHLQQALLRHKAGLAPASIPAQVRSQNAVSSQEIVFASTFDGSLDLWLINADGTGRVNISKAHHDPTGSVTEQHPRWSLDGTRIAFLSDKTGKDKIWIMDADGQNDFELTSSDFLEINPFWSPDGLKLFFGRNTVATAPGSGCGHCPHWEIFVYDLTDGSETQLTVNASRDVTPTVSPDGNTVAFARAESPNDCCNPTNLWTMSPDGSNQQQLVPASGGGFLYEFPSAWTSNSNEILAAKQFGSSSLNAYEVVLVSLDGTLDRITNNNVYDYPLAFSPDEEQILFYSTESGPFELWIMNTDGANRVQLTNENPLPQGADWRASNTPPVANAGDDQTIECTASTGTSVTLNGTGSSDPDDDPLTFTWTGPFPEGGGTVTGPTPIVTLPLGVHTITLTVDDGNSGTDTDAVEITIEDTTPPEVAAALIPVGGSGDDDDDDGFAAKSTDDDDDDDGSTFAVECTASDTCDADPAVASVIVTPILDDPTVTFKTKSKKKLRFNLESNKITVQGPDPQAFWAQIQNDGGVTVSNSQVLSLIGGDDDDDDERIVFRFDNMSTLKSVDGGAVILRCTATDASGNTATAEATPPTPGEEDDDDDDGADKTGIHINPSSVIEAELPQAYALKQNYPNPFNPTTVIAFALPEAAQVRLVVFDILGREVARLIDGQRPAGHHQAVFKADHLPSGTYLYRIEAGLFAETRMMLLLK